MVEVKTADIALLGSIVEQLNKILIELTTKSLNEQSITVEKVDLAAEQHELYFPTSENEKHNMNEQREWNLAQAQRDLFGY